MAHEHSHRRADTGSLKLAFFLNLGFSILEIAGGIWANSVAILSDAVHDLGDSFSIGMAWFLERFSEKGRDARFSYGYRRFSVLGALVNSLVLITGSIFVLSEAIPRILSPEKPKAEGMILFAVIGILVNGAAVLRMRGQKSLNTKVVAWHLLEDVFGWTAVLIAGVVLLFSDFYIIDPILSIAITLYILYNVARNLKKSLSVFLQAVPEGLRIRDIEAELTAIEGVKNSHHTHVWSLDGERHILTTHIVVDISVPAERIPEIKRRVRETAVSMGLYHTTVEIETTGETCEDEECE
jgi:cobalt-zinc-cadmium efflux system protein